jgi:hypothetical protein
MIGWRAEARVVGPRMARDVEAFRPGPGPSRRSGDNDDPRWLDRAMHCSHACRSAAAHTNTTSIRREVSRVSAPISLAKAIHVADPGR